jgi:hypothetical protein
MRKLIRRLLHNLDLKVIALLLAILTWHYLTTSGLEQRRFRRLDTRILDLPEDAAVLSPGAPELTVILEGPRGQLDALESRRLLAEFDLGDVEVEPGERVKTNVRVLPTNIRVAGERGRSAPLPPPVRFLSADPASFTLTLESVTERELPVEPVITGSPAPSYAVETTVQPAAVMVRGPFRLLQNLSSIRTEPIAVDGLRDSLRQTVPLETEVTTREGPVEVRTARSAVDVLVEVAEKPEEKIVERVPIRLAAVPEGLAVIRPPNQPREATVTLRGPQRLLDEIDARTLAVEANFEDVAPPENGTKPFSTFFLREHLRHVVGPDTSLPLPQGITLVDVDPKTMQVLLDGMASRTLPVQAELEGRPAEDYEVTATALPEKVAVRGPRSVIEQLDRVPTEPILVTGLKDRLRRPVPLVQTADTENLRGVRIHPDPPTVDVVLSAVERRVRKTLEGLPVHVLTVPRPGLPIRVELDPQALGPVVFEGPRSHIERLTADDVVAFVRLDATALADRRSTIRNVEFRLADPQIHLAPDAEPAAVKIEFPAEPDASEPGSERPTAREEQTPNGPTGSRDEGSNPDG